MTKIEDFKNAPVGATATNRDGSRAMKTEERERSWVTQNGNHLSDVEVGPFGFTLDAPARPLPTRDEIARTIYDVLNSQYGSFNVPHDAADAVLALLKGQEA